MILITLPILLIVVIILNIVVTLSVLLILIHNPSVVFLLQYLSGKLFVIHPST